MCYYFRFLLIFFIQGKNMTEKVVFFIFGKCTNLEGCTIRIGLKSKEVTRIAPQECSSEQNATNPISIYQKLGPGCCPEKNIFQLKFFFTFFAIIQKLTNRM